MSHSPRAHSRVVHPELKNTRPSLGGKYGRMFPGLLPCEVDPDSAVRLGRAASRMDATLPVVDEALENSDAAYRFGHSQITPTHLLNAEPGWRPTLPSAEPGEFGMADLVVFAGTAGAPR